MKAKIRKVLTAVMATGLVCSATGLGVYALVKNNNRNDGLNFHGEYSLSAFAETAKTVNLNVAGNSKAIDATETLSITSNDGKYKLYLTAIDLDDFDEEVSVNVGYVYDGSTYNGTSKGLNNVYYSSLTIKTGENTTTTLFANQMNVDASITNPGFIITEVTANSQANDALLVVNNTNSAEIKNCDGNLEASYITWGAVSGAEWYNVYVKESTASSYTKLDDALVRQYSSYYRADAVGLKAGTYDMKVVPTDADKIEMESYTEIKNIKVEAHDRSGYGFVNGTSSGAYNEDGTLKSNAVVLYITEETKDTVSLDVVTSSKGATTNYVGLQNILTGIKKGYDSRPVSIRLIGNITDFATMDKGDIVIDESQKDGADGITFEGIGNDATANGWGLRIKSSSNVEVRNIGFMNCDSSEGDDVGLQQDNNHVWVHNCDFFYGNAGSDADQIKGDGALDTKTSTYVTHSYNRFYDCGKCNLQGMKEESTSNYITYHHNWYDHSDSRHPRIRTCTVHIYNNYFDGNAKYGVGVTMGASAFVENNYFRSTSKLTPMLSSGQGTDADGEGTFSGETGGIIKSFGNTYDCPDGKLNLITYKDAGSDSDCYEASTRDEQVPSNYTTISGGTSYSNFDTAADFYEYSVDTPDVAKIKVEKWAGRVDHGDFVWEFTDSTDDPSYAVNTALKSAITNYSTTLVKVGDTTISSGGGSSEGTAPTITSVTATASKTSGAVGDTVTLSATVSGTGSYDSTVSWKITSGSEYATLSGSTLTLNAVGTVKVQATANGDSSVTSNVLTITISESSTSGGDTGNTGDTISDAVTFIPFGTSDSRFTVSGSAISHSEITVDGVTIPKNGALKLASTGTIAFTTSVEMTLTLYAYDNSAIKVDTANVSVTASGSYYVGTTTIVAGSHTIAKGDGENALYMLKLAPTGISIPVAVESVSLNKSESSLKVGESETLTATVSPANADNTAVTWSSSDDTIATVVNGVVTALKAGEITITATSAENEALSASCTYTITNVAPTSVTLNTASVTIAVGDTLNLTATVAPTNATVKTVTWKSSNTSVATVDANGKVTAVGTGSVTITATADDATSVTATCTITVKDEIVKVTGIALNYSNEKLNVGDTLQLIVTVTPDNAEDKSVTWTTSNSAIATVSTDGLVTVVGEGSVVITATSNINSSATATCTITASYVRYTVTYKDGSTTKDTQSVISGQKTTAISLTKDGYSIEGWYTDSALTSKFDFSTPITSDITLYAKWVKSTMSVTYSMGNFESAAIEWADTNASSATVSYKLASADDSEYVAVDSELIRQIDSDTARVDVLGLKGGNTYNFKVTSSANGETIQTLDIKSYDRSGYAHFNYTKGIGAYNDDGTLKDNAIVIYVTNENKDTVMKDVVAKYSGVAGYEDLKMFQIPYCAESGISSKWNGKDADGIGWWLNNAQYTMNNANSTSNKVPSNTYDTTGNGSKLGFRMLSNNPVVIRFIGTVDVPEGCTAYDCEQEGGSVGDNGNMARMKNCQHITLEGVGEDAQIHGWGIHFMGGSDATGDQGMSFEVRNLTFYEYTEDAIGMEGVQGGTQITGPVEHCWIHRNTFLPGHCENPAESDKAEGDGSCDFKRGQYFTCAYNWFEYCHKTNLVGSSDSSLQFNLTYHHNVWWQCGSRIPLARQANIHFYNNYVYGDASETTTPYSWISKPALSYVHSLRANCYIYSENNYYDGCKNVTDGKNGGKAKAWNNIYFACTGTNTLEEATTREQTISGSCSYSDGTTTYDYSAFDTNPNLFYYDSENKVSDCAMTDAVTARQDCLRYSGVLKHDYSAVDTRMITQTPSSAIDVPESGLTIDMTQSAVGKEVSGVLFVNGKNSSGVAKGKDIIAVFTLAYNTEVSISGTSIEIANVDGTHLGTGSYNGSLDAGTYYVRSSEKAKEGSISSMTFKSGVTDEEKVANVEALISAIGTVELTEECNSKITSAQSAYNALSSTLKAQVSNASTLTTAVATYNQLSADPVIELINAIGTVNASSGTKITEARNAYSALTADQKLLVTNYATLVSAEEAYVEYEVEGINDAITALADPSTATTETAITELLAEYNTVKDMYDGLSEEQKAQVTNYSKVTDGIATLNAKLAEIALAEEQAQAYTDITTKLNAVTSVDALTNTECAEIVALYNKLSSEKQTEIAANTTYIAVKAKYDSYASQAKTLIFSSADNATLTEAGVTITGGSFKTASEYTVGDNTYTTSYSISNGSVTFSLSGNFKMTVYMTGDGASYTSISDGKRLTVNGTTYSATNSMVVVDSITGDVTITKGDSCRITYIVLEPIA
ncbi:MAG: Ig-like domain-containing protein [Candidatus Coproplasma sp.]